MKRKFGAIGFSVVLLLGIAVMPVWADSISPTSVSGTIGVGGTITVSKTVTVSAGTPTAAQGDVFFLCDTTGSMGDTINSVKTNASAILTGLSGYGNIQTGAGSYRDFPTSPWGGSGDYAYRLDAAISGTPATTQSGINTWLASGGSDGPESQLYALQQVATSAGTGWRAGSEKFVIWFGDYYGHEPSNTPGYPGPSTAATIAALQAAGVSVYAFADGSLDSTGQVTSIVGATGGFKYTALGTDVVNDILAAITLGFSEYSTVGIDAPSLAGLGISIVPTFYTGDYDRSIERTFGFDVTFTGLAPGTYDFSLYGTVDGGRIATETDHIVVTGTAVPEPGTLLLMGLGLLGLVASRKKLS